MLSIDEAIAHAREVANTQKGKSGICLQNGLECEHFSDCLKCAEEHEQLVEWLEELKAYREIGTVEECRNNILDILKAYNKAIDDVGKALLNEIYTQNIKMIIYGDGIDTLDTQISPYKLWDNIAEQLKEQNK